MSTLLDTYLINHVVFVLDASISMRPHVQALIKATDAQIKHLSLETGENKMNQETRVAVYTFDDTARCVVPERDVHRLPSISEVYRVGGNTALVDATTLALDDAGLTSQKYGNHAFLIFVLTDGEENSSSRANKDAFPARLRNLPDNVTVACLVPDAASTPYYKRQSPAEEAAQWGFLKDNIAEWNTSNVETATKKMATATTTYLQARASGLRSTNSLFSMDASVINAQTVQQNLVPLSTDEYTLVPVTKPKSSYENGEFWWIKDFAEFSGHTYTAGHSGYYQFVYVKGKKPSEVITPTKKVIVVHRDTGLAYGGPAARKLLNLPDNTSERIRFDRNPDYDIYILSSANNRHLIPGTNLLIKK
jgi:uncharacterized protein YegL